MQPHLISDELNVLTKTLAGWAGRYTTLTFYVFGSRVRGDHRPNSDVDILFMWTDQPSDVDTDWWEEQNDEKFASVNLILPGKLQLQCRDDPMEAVIIEAAQRPVLRIGNIVCVWLPRLRGTSY